MNIIFYKNSAEQNRMDKTDYIEEVLSIEGTLRDNTSIVNPTIIVQTSGLISANYAYIEEFNRYYFINDIVAINLFLYEISMTCDVLMTYKNEIKNLSAIVSRNENIYNTNIEDKRLRKSENVEINLINSTASDFFGDYNAFDFRFIVSHLSNEDGTTLTVENPRSFITNRKALFYVTNLRTFLSAINNEDFKNAMNNLFANNPLEGILSIRLYPFSLTKFWGKDGVYYNETINLGSYTINLKEGDGCYDCSQAADSSNTKDVGLFDLTTLSNDWKNYFSSYSLYLPFYGFTELSAKDIIGYYLKITYVFDFDQGTADIQILRSTDNNNWELFSILECTVSINIPYSANNTNERARDNIFSALTGVVSALTSVFAIPATGGMSAATLPLTITHTVKDIVDNSVPSYTLKSVSSGPAPFLYAPQNPYIIVKKPVWITPDNYAIYNGLPCYQTLRIGTLSGYTEIEEIHLENISVATKNELDMIYRILKDGFII